MNDPNTANTNHHKYNIKAESILNAIAYFDIFNHPLTKKEIINLCENDVTVENFDHIINDLIKEGRCFNEGDFYSIQENIKQLVNQRHQKEKSANNYFKKLPFFVGLIKRFPFVRGVAISGSLSKGVMYEDGDIDYFIVTAPERLWICRSLLVLFKKVFLLNSKKYFCVNYFVDENNLEIIDKNMFTAVEISYLLPVFNTPLINKLKEENSWTKNYFPQFKHPLSLSYHPSEKKKRKGMEVLFRPNFANQLDLWLMKMTFKRWQKKFSHFSNHKFELTMRTNRGISKHHPQDFQNKVLNELNKKIAKLK